MIIEKIPFERRVNESVDDMSLPLVISQKVDIKQSPLNKGLTDGNNFGFVREWQRSLIIRYHSQQNKCYPQRCRIFRKTAVNCSTL